MERLLAIIGLEENFVICFVKISMTYHEEKGLTLTACLYVDCQANGNHLLLFQIVQVCIFISFVLKMLSYIHFLYHDETY